MTFNSRLYLEMKGKYHFFSEEKDCKIFFPNLVIEQELYMANRKKIEAFLVFLAIYCP
jgi:hypothetical protein